MASTSDLKVFELECALQQYHWGKKGGSSEVAQLKRAVDPGFVIKENETYAELWMGAHPSGMSLVKLPQQPAVPLSDWLSKHPGLLGDKGQTTLPYLFKILSVNMALSIQAHPNKLLAQELYRTRPDLYKDPNHKPEMAIALTPFNALCGFRKIEEIRQFFKEIPELAAVVGEAAVTAIQNISGPDQAKAALRQCFTALVSAEEALVQRRLQELIERIKSMESRGEKTDSIYGNVVCRLYSQFPGDVGCFGVYFLNYLELQPGQALYLGADEAHAYISGDCVECMACSDNVVRAGLTPKFKDVPTLCSMLTYTTSAASDKVFRGVSTDQFTTVWRPPVDDFAVAMIKVSGVSSYTLPPIDSASIVITIRGRATSSGLELARGRVVFVAANHSVELKVDQSAGELLAFRAFSNS